MGEKYKPIRQQKASDLIVTEIWGLIKSGTLKPGDRLPPERELVEKFEVSKVTLREALQTLEVYGHITKKRGADGGSIVLDIAPARGVSLLVDYLEANKLAPERLLEAAELITPMVAALAAERITPKGARELRQLIEAHERDFQSHGGSKRGWEFGILLARISRNHVFVVIEELLMRLIMDMEFSLSIGDIGSTPEELEYNARVLPIHRSLAEAVIAGPPEHARSVAEQGVKALNSSLLEYHRRRRHRRVDPRTDRVAEVRPSP